MEHQTGKVEPDECKKRKGQKLKAAVQSENSPVHAGCNSPQSCKKCRIMRRLSKIKIRFFR